MFVSINIDSIGYFSLSAIDQEWLSLLPSRAFYFKHLQIINCLSNFSVIQINQSCNLE